MSAAAESASISKIRAATATATSLLSIAAQNNRHHQPSKGSRSGGKTNRRQPSSTNLPVHASSSHILMASVRAISKKAETSCRDLCQLCLEQNERDHKLSHRTTLPGVTTANVMRGARAANLIRAHNKQSGHLTSIMLRNNEPLREQNRMQ